MDIAGYLDEIRTLHKSGETTEHSFRPALERLFRSIDDDLTVINEPKQLRDVGAPDFVFARNGVSIGWCEAKDIGKDISKFKASDYSKEQKERYRKGLPNLIYTNGTDFEFIREGEKIAFITIADFIPTLPARDQNFEALENMLREFVQQTPISIGTAKALAKMMAGKAAIIKDIMAKALVKDREAKNDSELNGQYEAFKANLIHDISVGEFADIYAETIAYGLFAARLHDETLDTFSRSEALELLPKSNPFLRKLFIYIAGPDLDERLRWIVDELCDVFRATDLYEIMKDFGKFTARNDPFIHFYEDFLKEYNPKKKKSRGVWYTPEPVVNFIVRAVDDVLKKEFGLADGLADTSKIQIDWDTGQTDKKGKAVTLKKDVHRVQILDPATGTGTFLAEVIKQVAGRVKGIAPGQWSSYVENDLIPRIHGFELLMASYAMCHMKLDMMLTELGYKPSGNPPRLGVYLTNSLEEGEKVEQNLFAQWLANEAKEASDIKRQTPIMCVIGNPPYSGESANKGKWIMDLMDAYKKEPGGKEKLKERNPKWINDDYVKFIRLAEHMIAKNGEGVLGFITNHGYLDNPTFRGMRWHLLKTFDKIYVLDLHGNSKKKEVCPDGSPDKNVFDIMQGVAIIIGVKKRISSLPFGGGTEGGASPSDNMLADKPHPNPSPKGEGLKLATVYHGDLWGSRKGKYDALWAGDPSGVSLAQLPNQAPQYPFVQRDFELEGDYQKGFSVADLMPVNSVGIVTARDALTIDMDKDALWQRVKDFTVLEAEELRSKYSLGKDVRDWRVSFAKADVTANFSRENLVPITYRPFDTRWTYYTGNSRGFQCYPRNDVMRHFFQNNNIGIATARSNKNPALDHFYVSANLMECKCAESSTQSGLFPLYLYPEEGSLDQSIRVNFDPKIYAEIAEKAGLKPSPLVGEGLGEGREASAFDGGCRDW
ncbi:MAG: type ISP restriction/modification enzyme [Sphingorhabdus sp.]